MISHLELMVKRAIGFKRIVRPAYYPKSALKTASFHRSKKVAVL